MASRACRSPRERITQRRRWPCASARTQSRVSSSALVNAISILRYATVADTHQRFSEVELIQISDPEGEAVDAACIDIRLDDAHALINSYIGRAYRLPLAGCTKPVTAPGTEPERVAPPQLTRIARNLARFWLGDAVEENSDVQRRYKAAMVKLEAIATDGARLACQCGGEAGEPRAQETAHRFAPRTITDNNLAGY
jgi:phage gp36-like protein